MATEQEKNQNASQVMGLMIMSMTMGIWDMIEESSTSLSPIIGEQVLGMAEKMFGLEVAGETPEGFIVDLGRAFVDELGLFSAVEVVATEKRIVATLKNSIIVKEMKMLKDHGVEKPFSDPFVCAGLAGLARLGVKARANVEFPENGKDVNILFDLVKAA